MENQTNYDTIKPATLRDALAYVTEYLLYDHPKTFNLEFQNPPRPNHLLEAVTLIQDWLGKTGSIANGFKDASESRKPAAEDSESGFTMPCEVMSALVHFFEHMGDGDALCDYIGIYGGASAHDALFITVAAWVREQTCK